jgi:hypothetical protein
MSDSNPSNPTATSSRSAAAAAGLQAPDFQQLAGLLGNLMPLLLRFQSQVLETPLQSGLGNTVVPEPMLDHQATVNLAEDIISGSLRTVSGYLEANAGQHAGLNNCIPIVSQATRSFAARNYAQAFNLIWMAYRAITTIQATDPRLPPLRASGQASSEQASSVH